MPRRHATALAAALLLLAAGCSSPAPAPAPAPGVAARVGAQPITLEAVDAQVQKAEPEAWQSLYEARRRALAFLIDERLLADEARAQGLAVEALVEREITGKVAPVSDSEVQTFYAQNQQRMDGQSLEDVRDRIRDYLTANSHHRARQTYLDSLRERVGVEVALEPPRAGIEADADEPSKGPIDAPIQLVEYSDFECPYCGRAQPAVQQVLATYGDKVRLVYRDFPLPMHEHAHLAAQAGQCAHEQGRFWEYHDVLFANARQLRAEDLKRHAATAGLDATRFDACLESGRFATGVDADLASGEEHGVSGTPAFFVNGRLLSGSQPFAAFQQIIDDELRGASAAD